MAWEVWSELAHDTVTLDASDVDDVSVEICDECNEEIDGPEARFDDGDPFCPDCWADLFGEDN